MGQILFPIHNLSGSHFIIVLATANNSNALLVSLKQKHSNVLVDIYISRPNKENRYVFRRKSRNSFHSLYGTQKKDTCVVPHCSCTQQFTNKLHIYIPEKSSLPIIVKCILTGFSIALIVKVVVGVHEYFPISMTKW